ncbi:MAG TPA: hypothetical protein VF170_13200 [Planctomycetaceae bacterium]
MAWPGGDANGVKLVLGAVAAAFALIGGGTLLMCAGCATSAARGPFALAGGEGPVGAPFSDGWAEPDPDGSGEPERPTEPGVFAASLMPATFSDSLEEARNGRRVLRRLLMIELPGDRDVKALSGTASVFAEDGRTLWRGPIRIREDVSERRRLSTFIEIVYDDRNADHRDIRAASDELSAEVRADRVEYADGTSETFQGG